MVTLMDVFGPNVAHLDHHPAVAAHPSLDSQSSEAASAQLQSLFLDPSIARIYHLDLSLSSQIKALHVATCRARQMVGRMFAQRQNETPVAPVFIVFGRQADGHTPSAQEDHRPHLAFEKGVALLADHLQLQEEPEWDSDRQAVRFGPLDLWALNGVPPLKPSGRILQELHKHAEPREEGQKSRPLGFVWHDHASMSLPATFLALARESNIVCGALLSSDAILQDMGAKSFISRLAPVSSSWRKVFQHCKLHKIPFVSAQASMARLGDRELDDIPNYPYALDLELRDSELILAHRQMISNTMSRTLLQTTQVMGACRRLYGKALASEVQDVCSEAHGDWKSLTWTHQAAGLDLKSASRGGGVMHPVSSCTFKAAKRNVHSIANTCGVPLNAPVGAFSSAVLDEFADVNDTDLLFLPVQVHFDRQRMAVGTPDSNHWILARTALPHLGGHFSEIMRWQGCRPDIITQTDLPPPTEAVINKQLATEWRAFTSIMSKLLVSTLTAILDLEDIEEQARWLEVVRELECAASRLAYGPMSERTEILLEREEEHKNQEEAKKAQGPIKSARTTTRKRSSVCRRDVM